jgi:hypothetical protein
VKEFKLTLEKLQVLESQKVFIKHFQIHNNNNTYSAENRRRLMKNVFNSFTASGMASIEISTTL